MDKKHRWDLEERTCKLKGCTKKFRVLPTSTAKFCSISHEKGLASFYQLTGERFNSYNLNVDKVSKEDIW